MVENKTRSFVCKFKCTKVSLSVCLLLFHLAEFILRLSLNTEASLNPEQNEAGLTKVPGPHPGSGSAGFVQVCFHLSLPHS